MIGASPLDAARPRPLETGGGGAPTGASDSAGRYLSADPDRTLRLIMRLPDHMQRQVELEKFRDELREITKKLLADLEKRLGLDKPWIRRG